MVVTFIRLATFLRFRRIAGQWFACRIIDNHLRRDDYQRSTGYRFSPCGSPPSLFQLEKQSSGLPVKWWISISEETATYIRLDGGVHYPACRFPTLPKKCRAAVCLSIHWSLPPKRRLPTVDWIAITIIRLATFLLLQKKSRVQFACLVSTADSEETVDDA
jgi:hypothetical protein